MDYHERYGEDETAVAAATDVAQPVMGDRNLHKAA
jgi:hypothetical protein